MAKALLGHIGGTDPRVLEEARRLRLRVRDLEEHILRLEAENDALAAALHDDHLLRMTDPDRERQPALT